MIVPTAEVDIFLQENVVLKMFFLIIIQKSKLIHLILYC